EAAAGGAVSTLVGSLWGGWAHDDVAAMLAASTESRDIPHLLCQAALRPLPRPTARSGELDRLRARARDAVPADARPAVATVLEAFVDAEVQVYTDFDRIRRPVSAQARSRRRASAHVCWSRCRWSTPVFSPRVRGGFPDDHNAEPDPGAVQVGRLGRGSAADLLSAAGGLGAGGDRVVDGGRGCDGSHRQCPAGAGTGGLARHRRDGDLTGRTGPVA